MKNISFGYLAVFMSAVFVFQISCKEEEECETCNDPPSIDAQIFSIKENSPEGTIVGTVEASDENGQKITFKIISGNPDNVFEINKKNGILTVMDPSFLDYESNPEFELAIEVTDSCASPLSSSNSVLISLIDVQPTQNGLVSFYNFEGSTGDLVGNNDGTGYDIEFIEGPGKPDNQFLLFNGTSSYVNLSNPFDLKVKTINLWFNLLKADSQFGIIYTSDNPNLEYGLTNLNVKLIESQPRLFFYTSDQADTVDIKENTWYNVTIVTEEKNYSYYLNGELLQSGECINYLASWDGTETALLGCLRTLNLRFFNGLIDDVRIYNRSLSEEEIKLLYLE